MRRNIKVEAMGRRDYSGAILSHGWASSNIYKKHSCNHGSYMERLGHLIFLSQIHAEIPVGRGEVC